ncbi:MAG: DUF4258 domain-containing protein [Nanoarchaeota archaeon]
MNIIYSYHAKKRMKERGIEHWEIENILKHPSYIKKSFEGRRMAIGEIKNRKLKIIYIKEESYIKVISVMFL